MARDLPGLAPLPDSGRIVVAFSGGPDSVCLLDELTRVVAQERLLCVHVDHQLDPESGARAERARSIAAGLGVDCRIVRVDVAGEGGPEAAAREARYAALAEVIGEHDTLVTAHHADDQVETILMRLLRGAGPEGLAGMPQRRRFGPGFLLRPLLGWDRRVIEDCIQARGLDWISDPANEQLDFDRNVLRRVIVPALRENWPGLDRAVLRSGELCAGAAGFIGAVVERQLDTAIESPISLALESIRPRTPFAVGEALRRWCLRKQLEPPPGRRLQAFSEQVLSSCDDRQPTLRWNHRVLRLWNRRLWLERDDAPELPWSRRWSGREPLELPAGLGRLVITGDTEPDLSVEVALDDRGESMRPTGDTHHRALKRLLAEAGIPPWQRPWWPRIRRGDAVLALGDRWLSKAFADELSACGLQLEWQPGERALMRPGLESVE